MIKKVSLLSGLLFQAMLVWGQTTFPLVSPSDK